MIERRDLYTLVVDGTEIRADDEQEQRIREMTPEQRIRFVRILGGSPDA